MENGKCELVRIAHEMQIDQQEAVRPGREEHAVVAHRVYFGGTSSLSIQH